MKTIKIQLPKAWNELSDKQLQQVAVLFNSVKRGTLFDLALLYILLDIKWWHFLKKVKVSLLLREVPLSELKEHYSYLYHEAGRTKFLSYMITKDEAYFAPQDRLQNLTAEEFAVAEDLQRVWYKNRDREALEYLAAVLYSTAPNIRPPFFKEELESKAKQFKSVALPELLAMELTYMGCKEYIVTRYPKAFPKSTNPGTGKTHGFGEVIHEMAGAKFGDHEKTRRTNIYTLLDEFEKNLIQAKKNGKTRNT